MHKKNSEALRQLVDGYGSARIFVLLNLNGAQRNPMTELDVQAAARALRDAWTPGTVWYDGAERGEEIETYWDVELLIAEMDARAEVDAAYIKEYRGSRYRGIWGSITGEDA